MKSIRAWLLLFPLAWPALAQKPMEAPKLSLSEQVAIGSLAEKLQANQKDRNALVGMVQQIEMEIAKEHPGYHFDEATGTVVKDAPKPTAAKQPEKAAVK